MANEMKTEFENYVRQLAETICKEIYLKDLEEICRKYTDQLEECQNLYTEHTRIEKEALDSSRENLEQIDKIKNDVTESMSDIKYILDRVQKEYDDAIHQYSVTVNEVNQELRDTFFQEFTDITKNVNQGVKQDLDECNRVLKETLQNVITPENLREYISKMEESTGKITEGISLLNTGCQEMLDKYTQEVSSHTQEEREKFQNMLEQYVRIGLNELVNKVTRDLGQQQKMLEEKIPDKVLIESMGRQIVQMRESMEQMQQSYEKKFNRLVKFLEREEKLRILSERNRHVEKRYWFLATMMNMISLWLLILLVCVAKPWQDNVLGIGVTAAFGGAICICGLGFLVMKKRRSKKLMKQKSELNGEKKS